MPSIFFSYFDYFAGKLKGFSSADPFALSTAVCVQVLSTFPVTRRRCCCCSARLSQTTALYSALLYQRCPQRRRERLTLLLCVPSVSVLLFSQQRVWMHGHSTIKWQAFIKNQLIMIHSCLNLLLSTIFKKHFIYSKRENVWFRSSRFTIFQNQWFI